MKILLKLSYPDRTMQKAINFNQSFLNNIFYFLVFVFGEKCPGGTTRQLCIIVSTIKMVGSKAQLYIFIAQQSVLIKVCYLAFYYNFDNKSLNPLT